MKRQVYKIDENGYLQEILVKDFDEDGNCTEELSENITTVDPPNGLYKHKWTGSEWIEGLSQEEIDEINNVPQEPAEVEMLRLEQAQANAEIIDLIMVLMMGGV
ncbi:MAG TPA: hypothetical protein DC038_03620 [Clostridiales bacterium]|nr:hypothetical protein [Clostridiales bacterium]